jgi:transcription elongation factor GreA
MDTETQYLTTEKFEELRKELAYLKAERRKEVAEHLEYAKRLGDLSENAEYHQAREEQAEVEDRVSRLENLLKNAVIAKQTGGDVATIGSKVTIERNSDERSTTYTIVGSEEADMAQGKISNLSPIGSALIGRKKSDNITVTTPNGSVEYTIVEVK